MRDISPLFTLLFYSPVQKTKKHHQHHKKHIYENTQSQTLKETPQHQAGLLGSQANSSHKVTVS